MLIGDLGRLCLRQTVFFTKIMTMKMLKKICVSLSTLTFILFALAFAGCADKEAEAEMARLTEKNASLQHTADSLQHTLDSLNAYSDSVKKSLQSLDMGI